MTKSLQERYEIKKVYAINERAKRAKSQLLINESMTRLLLEAMDENDLKTAEKIIDKLRSMKGKGLKNLDVSISEAESELSKYTGGGALTQAWTKIKSSLGLDNPLVKVMTFANALEKGFKQFPSIIKNVIGGNVDFDDSKSITDMGLSEDQQKNLISNMRKALAPEGIFGMFKKVPYINNDKLISDLISVPIKNLMSVVNVSNSGPQTSKIANDIQSQFKGGTQTNQTTSGAASKSSEETSGTNPTSNTAKSQSSKDGSQGQATKQGELKQITDSTLKNLSQDILSKSNDDWVEDMKASINWLTTNGYIETK